ncbi:MAG: ABC transporter ATP-binding protein [Clostridium sp.]|uniref:ABC transporter ATP-binding protein n=1 Tax=Clostridium sp. TaxID=1506 RepID=UPI0039E773E8
MFKLLRFAKPYKKQIILGPIFKLLEAILEILMPTIMVLIVDKGIKIRSIPYILEIGGIMIVIATLGVTSAFTCQYFASIASQGFGTILREKLFNKIGTLSYSEIDEFGTSSLINRVTNDINQLQLALAMFMRLAIRVPFLCLGGIIMAMLLDVKLSSIMYLSMPIIAFAIYMIMSRSLPIYKTVQRKLDKLALILRENLSGIRVIRAFSKMDYEKIRFKNANKDQTDTSIRVGKISALMNPATSIIMNFSVLFILWFGGIRVNNGFVTRGKIIAYINYTTLVLSALIIVANLIVLFTKAAASAARVNEIFDTNPSIEYKDKLLVDKLSNKNRSLIKFENVSFAYKNSKKNSISNISFDIKKGETVGIIGGTGSGKTTLINLIPRLYDASEGKVFINGIDVAEYPKEEIGNKIGLVPQKAALFSGSILENIKWGKEDASIEEIKKAAEISKASEFIEKLPLRYETNVSQGGVNLSGGQKQRLTIARAIVRKPEILIMDDSLSALDYATDAALRSDLRKNTEGMTIIMVSQRISTIKASDKIIVLDNGLVSGVGSHEELMKNSDVYREICNSQLSKESDKDE